MISFVYLGVGEFDSVSVFKIGKTSYPKKRYVALGIDFTGYIACVNDEEALALEHLLQAKARFIGAKTIPNKSDWFYYDEKAYQRIFRWFETEAEALIESLYYLTGLEDFDYRHKSKEPDTMVVPVPVVEKVVVERQDIQVWRELVKDLGKKQDALLLENMKLSVKVAQLEVRRPPEFYELMSGLFAIKGYLSNFMKLNKKENQEIENVYRSCSNLLEILYTCAQDALSKAGLGNYMEENPSWVEKSSKG